MLALFNRARNKRAKGEDGFTLIELLVVVVILGILIAIAIPVYLNYKKSANDKAAQSDLRNATSTFEVCNSDAGYPSAATIAKATGTGTLTGCDSQTLNGSVGTTLTYFLKADKTAYIAETTNDGGSGKVYCYSSVAGGSVKAASATVVAVYTAACPAPAP